MIKYHDKNHTKQEREFGEFGLGFRQLWDKGTYCPENNESYISFQSLTRLYMKTG